MFFSWENNGYIGLRVRVMVFNDTFNNISVLSWRAVLLVEETEYREKFTDRSQVPDKFIT